ncbi:SIMPL domain-containing protein [Christensenella intestinihominis]|uniref:SIMPL domain-containing protein n=1 Tax=Christensenella intestinihominis TaxID=1851429 RepID=UPI0015612566|nr:SIMPL domain-containing protein [Christensenella intestinihominis]
MKKQWILVVLVVLTGALVLAGCDSSAVTPGAEPTPTPAATQSAAPAVTETPDIASESPAMTDTASAAAAATDSTLTVSATESVKKMPDIAYVSIGVRTTGATAQAAQEENARITQSFLGAVKAQGVAEDDLETQSLNVYEDYENPQQTVVENTYRVTIRDIDTVGAVIDAAVAAGANSTYSLSFDLADRDSVYMEALAKAMENVGNKANAVAQAGGYAIVRPASITEGSAGYSAEPYMTAEAAAMDTGSRAGGATPVSPQEIEVSATVTGTYIIK